MSIRRLVSALAFPAVLFSAPALAQTNSSQSSPPMQCMAAMNSGASPADQAMMAGMAKMNYEMSAVSMTGDPDHDFVAMMIPHHQGAVSMAEVELGYGHDPMLRRLATEIIAAQDKEIAVMKGWLRAHQRP